jgi:ligand-binding sensor domain-containing protein/signal transduction histidine kinase
VVTPGNNPLAGKITAASDYGFTQTERVIQLGLKYSFSSAAKMKRADRGRSAVIAACMLLVWRADAFALDSSLDVSQYAHTAWKVGEGLPSGLIRAIAQTADGYLWLGTEFGLLRFDGVRAVPWEAPAGEHLPTSDIRSLQGARDGRLWIGTFRGLASWKDGKLSHYPELDGQVIEALLEDREGTIWVAGWAPSVGRLCRIQRSDIRCYGEDGRFGSGVTPLYQDAGGNVWAGAMNGLWRWKPGAPSQYAMPDPAQRIYALAESDDGGILIAKHSGVTKLRNGKTEAYPLPAGLPFQPHRLLRDRNGGLWIGASSDRGLLHMHQGKADLFTTANGLSGESVTAIFEDREGSIWVATADGVDRFREFAITTIAVQQGLSSQGVGSILAAGDGSIWVGTSEGLNRWHRGEITVYRTRPQRGVRSQSAPSPGTVREITDSGLPGRTAEAIFEDHRGQIWVGTQSGVAFLKSGRFSPVSSVPYGVVHSIAGDNAGNLWMSHQDGLFHLLEARLVERLTWAQLGRREPATALLSDARQGGLWLGFRDGGVAFFNDGQIRASYAADEGLGEGMVRTFHTDASGSLWAATDGGLSRIKAGRVQTLTSRNGLPCNMVHWMMEDDADSVWLYTACGLVRIAQADLDAWASNPKQTIQAALFDSSDGVTSNRFPGGYSANVAKSADGTLWFLRAGGVGVIDPHHLAFNKLPPPVHIEQVTADGKIYDVMNGLPLPAGVRDLSIDYTALSLVAPEKVRFRYMLEGQDANWKEIANDRRVQYSNLPPGSYRFRVTASNNSGVWNDMGASLDFSVAPAYYQTRWFEALVLVSALTLLWIAYELRMRQVARQFNRTLDARVSERTRIARDFHDTLLQSFQGALLQFQSIEKAIASRPDEARERLNRALDQAEAAITEGRNAVHGLRASTMTLNDLAKAIAAFGAELTGDPTLVNAPAIAVEIDGASRMLNPLVRDEAYRIASEALRNAIRHAAARYITVTIHYEPRQLRLTIIDDGKGIAAETLAQQQVAGHFGLPGMRERAAVVKGQLDVRSAPGAGAEIELRVPAAIAYRQRPSWWSRLRREPTDAAAPAVHD